MSPEERKKPKDMSETLVMKKKQKKNKVLTRPSAWRIKCRTFSRSGGHSWHLSSSRGRPTPAAGTRSRGIGDAHSIVRDDVSIEKCSSEDSKTRRS